MKQEEGARRCVVTHRCSPLTESLDAKGVWVAGGLRRASRLAGLMAAERACSSRAIFASWRCASAMVVRQQACSRCTESAHSQTPRTRPRRARDTAWHRHHPFDPCKLARRLLSAAAPRRSMARAALAPHMSALVRARVHAAAQARRP